MAVKDGEITLRTVVPVVADEHETFPVLVNIHGGGKWRELQCSVLMCSWYSSRLIRLERRQRRAR